MMAHFTGHAADADVKSEAYVDSDVIAAISTPHGIGAVGVVRLSGDKALEDFSRIFRASFSGRGVTDCGQSDIPSNDGATVALTHTGTRWESHRMYYGLICGGDEVIDEVMACCMLAPAHTRGKILLKYMPMAALPHYMVCLAPRLKTERAWPFPGSLPGVLF